MMYKISLLAPPRNLKNAFTDIIEAARFFHC